MIRLLAALAVLLVAVPAAAQPQPLPDEKVLAGLSQNRVAITANFDGTEILVFGAIKRDAPPPGDPPLEVIVSVTGPSAPVNVRKKGRAFGIWINTEAVEIDAAPRYYAIATTGPLFEILSHTEDLRHRISIPRAIRSVGAPPEVADAAQFSEALVRLRRASGHYRVVAGEVALEEQTLFSASFLLPANLTEGAYTVRIFLTRGRAVVGSYTTILDVQKVGLERFAYTLAHEHPLVYGLLAILIAVAAGWGASAAFRYIRS
jgi:uncharacterized protein (TIGR02186 family)